MARWELSYFQARDIAVRRLISAHPGEYERLLDAAKAGLPAESCEQCAYLGAAALELADLLGHDLQGHLVHRALWSHQIRSVAALIAALDGDLGLYYLRGDGLGTGGLERVHDRLRRLERAHPAPGPRGPRGAPSTRGRSLPSGCKPPGHGLDDSGGSARRRPRRPHDPRHEGRAFVLVSGLLWGSGVLVGVTASRAPRPGGGPGTPSAGRRRGRRPCPGGAGGPARSGVRTPGSVRPARAARPRGTPARWRRLPAGGGATSDAPPGTRGRRTACRCGSSLAAASSSSRTRTGVSARPWFHRTPGRGGIGWMPLGPPGPAYCPSGPVPFIHACAVARSGAVPAGT